MSDSRRVDLARAVLDSSVRVHPSDPWKGSRQMFIAWALLGVLIGIAAAQKKGFSTAGGIIGGLLLGPLAFLLFFVSGITKGDQRVKCPHCAEFIKPEATVCKHCSRDVARVQARPRPVSRAS